MQTNNGTNDDRRSCAIHTSIMCLSLVPVEEVHTNDNANFWPQIKGIGYSLTLFKCLFKYNKFNILRYLYTYERAKIDRRNRERVGRYREENLTYSKKRIHSNVGMLM